MNTKRLDWDFGYHAPDHARALDHERIRGACRDLAATIDIVVPDGREKSLAITRLEEVMAWTNAAIARQDRPEEAR